MRKAPLTTCLLVFLCSSALGRVPFEPDLPAPEKLPQGMTLFIAEEHELPTVELILFFPGGSLWDPAGKEGLATLALQGLRFGGSLNRSASQIEEELDFMGASLEVGHDQELGFVQLRLTRENLRQGLEILFDLLQRPAFDPGEIETVRNRIAEGLRHDREDPLRLAFREFPQLVYGRQSAWGRRPTQKSIRKIRRKDLQDYHARFIAPDRIVGGVSGDFSILELMRELKIRLADWRPLETPPPEIPPVRISRRESQSFLPFPALQQATIVLGHQGLKRNHPDKFALLAVNYLLGGSGALSSRLGEEIRTREGMAYSVWSHLGFASREGLFYTAAQTSRPQTGEVIRRLKDSLRQMASEPGISSEEVERAKSALLRSMFFEYETRFALVRDLAKFTLWGYPRDYLTVFQEKIMSLTTEQMERASRDFFKPEELRLLVIGDPQSLKEIKAFGKFRKIKR